MNTIAAQVERTLPAAGIAITGRVGALRGLTLHVDDLPAPVGSLVELGPRGALGEVVGFTRESSLVMLLDQAVEIRVGDRAILAAAERCIAVGDGLLGRVVDALGRPIDARGPLRGVRDRGVLADPIPAMRRRRIRQPLATGVRAVDALATLGRGQRIGIFAGPGVGKSTLLASIARGTTADLNVIALIGERGREVGDFIERTLGPDGLGRSIVVVATGDESPLMRVRAALGACAIAEHFRDEGRDVLLMMDSVTRFAHAQRQIGLSAGEPPATKGYTPSVFAQMSRLLERAGALEPGPDGRGGGSITGIYTILVDGDDMTEPISDAARGILDGHIILSRRLAQRAHHPAIDVLDSVSRVADDVSDPAHAEARRIVLRLMGDYRDVEDLVQIGAYATGSSAKADIAIAFHDRIEEFLRQPHEEPVGFDEGRRALTRLAADAKEMAARRAKPRSGGG